MAGSYKSGPLGREPEVRNLNDGTHIRTLSPSPGAIGIDVSIASNSSHLKEQSWLVKLWEESKQEIGQAIDHPVDGVKGAGKGIANIVFEVSELVINKVAIGEAQLASWSAGTLGYTYSAELLKQTLKNLNQGIGTLKIPKFEMNAAERGGDKIFTGVTLAMGVGGLIKGGIKTVEKGGIKALGNEGKIVKAANVAGKGRNAEKAVVVSKVTRADGSVAKEFTTTAKDGLKIKARSLRGLFLGKTPGKGSKTGKEVIERMRNAKPPTIREGRKGTEFKALNGKWYSLKEADMAHQQDAVKWWNAEGRNYGARSPEVKKWMKDPNNYRLDHYGRNRSAGASLPDRYLPSTQ